MSGELPSGTVTFLFTDIERSTQTVAELGDERYADVQDEHRRLLRESFIAHKGAEVGTEGDAFFIAFARAGDAVQAAVDGQRALDGHALRVRMGIHTGEAVVREGGYVGHDVHKAKRISDAGHGGQVLVSQATAELVRGQFTLRDLGPHRLKDLGEPERLYQVGDGDFPPLRTLESTPHNLPAQLTSFVGRERELEELAELLARHRLVTLTGVGGCGKTRLAVHAAAGEADSSPDGVYFCDLSRLADEESVAPAIARSLGIDLSAEPGPLTALPMMDVIRNFLSRRDVLIVLDNCEHLIGAVAELVEDLLTSCPRLRILATSREAIDVPGEQTWPIPSLEATHEAVQLFADRAAAVHGAFELTDANRPDIEAICSRLDGIPLAIELAAAQIGHLSPRQIAERLDRRFMVLTGGRRRVQRQQTLQAAMDWSWDLLDERDQTLLRRLSVFQGGCTLEAAESVCGEGVDVVSGLRSLVGKSLVTPERVGGDIRYRLLETVRLYAEDKQAESGEAESVRSRHRDHYIAWAEAIPLERTLRGDVFGSELEPEEDNVRAALRWSEAEGDFVLMGRLLAATRRLWMYRWKEASRWFAPVLDADVPDPIRGRVITVHNNASPGMLLDPQRLDDQTEAISLLEGDGPDPWLLHALANAAVVSFIHSLTRRDESLAARAEELARASIELGERLGPFWNAVGQEAYGGILIMRLRVDEAAATFAEACRNAVAAGHRVPLPWFDSLRALRHILGPRWPDDLDRIVASAMRPEANEPSPSTSARALELGDAKQFDEAQTFLEQTIEFGRERAPALWFSVPFTYGAAVAGLEGRWGRAGRLLAAAMKLNVIGSAGAYATYRHWVPRVREAVGAEVARRLRDEGRTMSLDQAIEVARRGTDG